MAFDSSGTFTRSSSGPTSGSTLWQDDAAAGTKILASRHDVHDQDLANGLSACLTRHGWGVPLVDIPWGGRKIINLANPTAGTQDAATANYVDTLPGWPKSKYIAGTDLDGRLNFTGSTGVNGITWTFADVAWVARGFTTGEANARLVMTNTRTPSTADVAGGLADIFVIDDIGHINANVGILSSNVSHEAAQERTVSPGIGTIVTFKNGVFNVQSNDVATITNNYATFTPRMFFQVANSSGSMAMTLQKNGTNKSNRILAMNGSENRWIMDLGNATAESSTRTGSDFILQSWDNTGANPVNEIVINRATHQITFGGEIAAPGFAPTTDGIALGSSVAGSNFALERPIGTGSFLIFGGPATGTGAYLQLYGETHATNSRDIVLGTNGSYRYFYDHSVQTHYWKNNAAQMMSLDGGGDLDVAGDITLDASAPAAAGGIWAGKGIRGKAGWTGAYGANHINLNWNGSALTAYADASTIGNLSFTCDYRIKKDIKPLGSMWDRVKALNPVSYTQRAFQVWTEECDERWGFLAHELQENLAEGAASGTKDGDDVQSLNPLVLIAALTKALQEAMCRIEALEAA